MRKTRLPYLLSPLFLLFLLLAPGSAVGQTISWTNPTTGIDNTGTTVPLTSAEQAALKNYLRYRPIGGAWTSFAQTVGGKTQWIGTLPVAAGVAADYSLSAALVGPDGIERESAFSPPVRYTRPFPPGPTPGAATGVTISP